MPLLLALAVVAPLAPGLALGARPDKAPDRLGEFLWALAGRESGWDYTTRNLTSGAYGRYQIMPVNWPHWADRYLGDRWADPTPRNQELVARGKVSGLHAWLGSWRRVAYWWLSGLTETDERRWSAVARDYVDDIMALMRRAPEGGDPIPPGPSADAPLADRGDWRIAVGGTPLRSRAGGGARVATVGDGGVVFVQAARTSRRGVLWLKVSTKRGTIGWMSIRRSAPWDRPDHPDRWPRDGRVTRPGPKPQPDDARRRARPRPR